MLRLTYSLTLTSLSEAINESANVMPRLWVSSHSHVFYWTRHVKTLTTTLCITELSHAATPYILLYNFFNSNHINLACRQNVPRPLVVPREERNLSFSTDTNVFILIVPRAMRLVKLFVCTLVNRHTVATSRCHPDTTPGQTKQTEHRSHWTLRNQQPNTHGMRMILFTSPRMLRPSKTISVLVHPTTMQGSIRNLLMMPLRGLVSALPLHSFMKRSY